MDARELARSARTTAAWTACEQVADYWLVLAERVELEQEQQQRIRVAAFPVFTAGDLPRYHADPRIFPQPSGSHCSWD